MKLRCLFMVSVLLFGCNINSQTISKDKDTDNTQVEWKNLPRLKSISVVDKLTAWAITTEKQQLWRTVNGGEKWEQVFIPSKQAVEAVYFLDKQQGWVVNTQTQVLSTQDAGISWKELKRFKVKDSDPSYVSTEQIQFIDSLHGWILETFSLRKTNDGGLTWQNSFIENETNGTPRRFKIVDNTVGYICTSKAQLLKTIDGGKTWSENNGGEIKCNNLTFINSNYGWVVGDNNIFQTTDGGRNWKKHQIIKETVIISSINFTNQNEGWAVGYIPEPVDAAPKSGRGVVFRTTNGGANWSFVSIESSEKFFSEIVFIDSQNGWLLGRDKLYRTLDSGQTWQNYRLP